MKAVLPTEIPVLRCGRRQPGQLCRTLFGRLHGFGIGSYLYKPGATLADIAARASATVAAYDRALQRPPG